MFARKAYCYNKRTRPSGRREKVIWAYAKSNLSKGLKLNRDPEGFPDVPAGADQLRGGQVLHHDKGPCP